MVNASVSRLRRNKLAINFDSCKVSARADVLQQILDFGKRPPLSILGKLVGLRLFWDCIPRFVLALSFLDSMLKDANRGYNPKIEEFLGVVSPL